MKEVRSGLSARSLIFLVVVVVVVVLAGRGHYASHFLFDTSLGNTREEVEEARKVVLCQWLYEFGLTITMAKAQERLQLMTSARRYPKPKTFSGVLGRRFVVESQDGARVCDDNDIDERHLNDISENIGLCVDVLYGSINGRSAASFVTPHR